MKDELRDSGAGIFLSETPSGALRSRPEGPRSVDPDQAQQLSIDTTSVACSRSCSLRLVVLLTRATRRRARPPICGVIVGPHTDLEQFRGDALGLRLAA